jgi:hypothetical protein
MYCIPYLINVYNQRDTPLGMRYTIFLEYGILLYFMYILIYYISYIPACLDEYVHIIIYMYASRHYIYI